MSDQWQNGKEMFEIVIVLREEMKSLASEMARTRQDIKKYNGLREDIADNARRLNEIEALQRGRWEVGELIRNWGGWLIALISLTYLLWGG